MTALLLGDITGRSRVALRMLSAVLEARGHEVLMLPTALISNTLNLGMHEALDTTDYLLRSLETWKRLGIRYDLAYIGYITGMQQAEKLAAVADGLREDGVGVIVDPILGDNGKKYNAVTQEQVNGFAMLAAHADLITPNLTEAFLLAGADIADTNRGESLEQLAAELAGKRRSVLITGAQGAEGQGVIAGWDAQCGQKIRIAYDRIPGHRWGTGDLFTGLLMDALMRERSLEEAVNEAAAHVSAQLRGEEACLLPEQ